MFKSIGQNLGLGDLVGNDPEDNASVTSEHGSPGKRSSLVVPNQTNTVGSSSPVINVKIGPLIASETEHPDVEDEEIMKKSKFRYYRDDIVSVLKSFDNTREWADLIKCLQKMKKVLSKNSAFPLLPEKITVSKRLAQCLNPALPSGVHLKTLETYEEIFKLITVSILSC